MRRVHFIAIGGSAMHNLALALHQKGCEVSGSDDEIFEPARGRLLQAGLLPEKEGWFPEKIDTSLDAIILGMHARADNPELLRALEMGLKVFSYPEFLFEQSKEKQRIVIGGSHGKTTITAMVLHAMHAAGKDTDYLVGAKLEGFDIMVRLTEAAPCMVFEGDEYLTSPIDKRPKFHLYRPHIALLSGIAWDHMNVFPTWENYLEQFRIFLHLIEPGGTLIYCREDAVLAELCYRENLDIQVISYSYPDHSVRDGVTFVNFKGQDYPLNLFGKHNLLNSMGASLVCSRLGLDGSLFWQAMTSFTGASNRLEKIGEKGNTHVYKDFAHAPSKVEATINAVKEQFPQNELFACLELHTFSSLSSDFLPQYLGKMNKADRAIVYFNPHALELKRLPPLSEENIQQTFRHQNMLVFYDSNRLQEYLLSVSWEGKNLLMMSSGNFDGINLVTLVDGICKSI